MSARPTSPQPVKAKRARKESTSTARKNRKNYSTSLGFSAVGFPKLMKLTHRYCENVQISTTNGSFGTYLFSCNGMFDPNITGTGHQPVYFDNMAALYDHYTVIGSRIKVTVSAVDGSGNGFPAYLCVGKDDDTSVASTFLALTEQNPADFKMVAFQGNEPVTMTSTWSAKATFGGSVLGNDNLQGTGSANPTEQTYYVIGIQPTNTVSTALWAVFVEIEYTAIWDELKTQPLN